MRIVFVRPGMTSRPSSDALEPLIFSVIQAATPADVELSFHDGMVNPLSAH